MRLLKLIFRWWGRHSVIRHWTSKVVRHSNRSNFVFLFSFVGRWIECWIFLQKPSSFDVDNNIYIYIYIFVHFLSLCPCEHLQHSIRHTWMWWLWIYTSVWIPPFVVYHTNLALNLQKFFLIFCYSSRLWIWLTRWLSRRRNLLQIENTYKSVSRNFSFYEFGWQVKK